MNIRITRIACGIFMSAVLAGQSANALIVKLTDLHTMAKRSDIVVHGYIGDQQVVKDKMGRLITLTDVEVIDAIHGAKSGEVITMYQVGGQKDGIVMPLLGGHQYHVGNEVILFGLSLDNAFVSYGAGQGKLDVVRENDKEIVVEDLGDVSAVGGSIGFKNQVYRPLPLSFPSKDELMDEIRLMVESR